MPEPTTQPVVAEYADEKAVAARFGFRIATMRTERCRGAGPPFYKVGGRILYRLDEVDAWVRSHRIEPGAKAGR